MGFPEDAVFSALACRTGAYGDFIRHDERRIEAHAELADQLAVFSLIGTHGLQEGFGAGFRDSTEMVNGFIAGHADAVIRDGQGAVLFIKRDAHAQFAVTFIQLWLRERTETQLVCRIRGVRDKLTQEDFFIGIKRMDHQMQKLFYF